jgi:hypothetical protein
MGLWDATKALFSGRGSDAANYLFVDSETVDASNEADRKLDQLNRDKLDQGAITKDDYRERLARLTNNAFPDFIGDNGERGKIFEQPGTNPVGGFVEGLKEGADNIRNTASAAINGSVGLTFKLIPWQIWALILGYLLFVTASFWLPLLTRKK